MGLCSENPLQETAEDDIVNIFFLFIKNFLFNENILERSIWCVTSHALWAVLEDMLDSSLDSPSLTSSFLWNLYSHICIQSGKTKIKNNPRGTFNSWIHFVHTLMHAFLNYVTDDYHEKTSNGCHFLCRSINICLLNQSIFSKI